MLLSSFAWLFVYLVFFLGSGEIGCHCFFRFFFFAFFSLFFPFIIVAQSSKSKARNKDLYVCMFVCI